VAGQPPEPSFQPSGQEPGQTQSRPAWGQPSYPPPPPPPPAAGGEPGYAAPSYGGQDQAYAAPPPAPAPDQGYAAQDPSYGNQDQTYTSLGQGQDYPGYQGYQSAGYGAQQGQGQGQGQAAGTPQWQGVAGAAPGARAKQHGEKGFIGSLFDFSFSSFVTPKIIKVLYVLFTIWTALVALSVLIIGFRSGGVAGGLFVLIIVEPILVLLWLGIARVVLEAFMVVFRMYEEIKRLRENSEPSGNPQNQA
jgi:hypothetical protein